MGRGKSAKSITLIAAAQEILEEIQPCSVRAVCYQLFNRGLIDSMSRTETNRVSTQLVWARENEHIPWSWIVDETRAVERAGTWRDPEAFAQAAQASFRRDAWQYQGSRVEVWSEKGTVRGTLGPVLDEMRVDFRVMHGYASATTVRQIAEETWNDRPLVALYVGDWDPSGLHMSEVDLPVRLADYGANEQTSLLRVALTKDDIGDELPSFSVDTKARDPRSKWFRERYGSRCWELDALSPAVLRERVEAAIVNLIDTDAWDRCLLVEKAEQNSLREVLGNWPSISRQASKCGEATCE